MKRLVAVAQLALCLVFVFCNNGNSQTRPPELVGQWEHGGGDDDIEKMELFKDGTGVVNGRGSISWKVENKRFVILSPLFAMSCNYKLSGYELTFIDDDGDTTIFVRKGKLEEFKAKQAAAAEAEKAKQIAEAKKVAEKAKASIGTFKDSRDGKTYGKVTIGGQTWMRENLNYAAEGGECYENKDANCEKYGRLYTWATALKACPAGFHLPTDDEWTALENAVGGRSTAGTKLKSAEGWNNNSNGTDDYGWSALPSGTGGSGRSFRGAGNVGYWWSATESLRNSYDAMYWVMYYSNDEGVGMWSSSKMLLFSVRCVQDTPEDQAFERGKKAWDDDKYDEAIAAFSETIRLNPNDEDAYLMRGHSYYFKKDFDKAIQDYSQVIRLNPNYAHAYEMRGSAYDLKKDYDRAIQDCNQAIRLNPNNGDAYRIRGAAYSGKKDYDRAIQDYNQAIRLNPSDAKAYLFRGLAYTEKEDYDRSIQDYSQAIRLDPNEKGYYLIRGNSYYLKEDYDRAIQDYSQAIRLYPNYVGAYEMRGNAYFNKKDYDRAIADYSEAIRLSPNWGGYYRRRGSAYFNKKDYDRAIADHTKAIELEPNNAEFYNNRCWTYGNKGEYDRAIADCNQAIRLDSKSAHIYHSRGFAYLGKKDYDKAIADFETALRIDPNAEYAKKDLAEAKKQKGGR